MPKSAEQRGTKTIIISYLAIAKKKDLIEQNKSSTLPHTTRTHKRYHAVGCEEYLE